jgi:hypothetical protein
MRDNTALGRSRFTGRTANPRCKPRLNIGGPKADTISDFQILRPTRSRAQSLKCPDRQPEQLRGFVLGQKWLHLVTQWASLPVRDVLRGKVGCALVKKVPVIADAPLMIP